MSGFEPAPADFEYLILLFDYAGERPQVSPSKPVGGTKEK
jgi:hypothetical protein